MHYFRNQSSFKERLTFVESDKEKLKYLIKYSKKKNFLIYTVHLSTWLRVKWNKREREREKKISAVEYDTPF